MPRVETEARRATMTTALLERLGEMMGRGLTSIPPAPVRSKLPNYQFTADDWGIADIAMHPDDTLDLNYRLSFFLFQLHYSQDCKMDTQEMCERRLESLARHLKSIGIHRREPLDFFVRVVTQELSLPKPIQIPMHLLRQA